MLRKVVSGGHVCVGRTGLDTILEAGFSIGGFYLLVKLGDSAGVF